MGIHNFTSYIKYCMHEDCLKQLSEASYKKLISPKVINRNYKAIVDQDVNYSINNNAEEDLDKDEYNSNYSDMPYFSEDEEEIALDEVMFKSIIPQGVSFSQFYNNVVPNIKQTYDEYNANLINLKNQNETKIQEEKKAIENYKNSIIKYGIYIDVSSLAYSVLMKYLTDNPSYQKYFEKNKYGKEEITCVIKNTILDQMAEACSNKILKMLNDRVLINSCRLYLSFDTLTSTSKLVEQKVRHDRSNLVISRDSREKIWLKTIDKLRKKIIGIYINLILYEDILTNDTNVNNNLETINELKEYTYSFSKNTNNNVLLILNDIVCKFLGLICVPKLNNAIDTNCLDFIVGEGEWKCFYKIREDYDYINIAFIYGNDWDIALGTVLYQRYVSRGPKIIYISKYNQCNSKKKYKLFHLDNSLKNSITFKKNLIFLSLSIIGNDYIPQMIGDTDSTFECIKIIFSNIFNGVTRVENCFETTFENGIDLYLTFNKVKYSLAIIYTLLFKSMIDVKALKKKNDDSLVNYFNNVKDVLNYKLDYNDFELNDLHLYLQDDIDADKNNNNNNFISKEFNLDNDDDVTDLEDSASNDDNGITCSNVNNKRLISFNEKLNKKFKHENGNGYNNDIDSDESNDENNKNYKYKSFKTTSDREKGLVHALLNSTICVNKDDSEITIKESLIIFLDSVLWYMSYTLFYKHLCFKSYQDVFKIEMKNIIKSRYTLVSNDVNNPQIKNNTLGNNCNFELNIGLPIKTIYKYNDFRLTKKFSFKRLADFRKIISKYDVKIVYLSMLECIDHVLNFE